MIRRFLFGIGIIFSTYTTQAQKAPIHHEDSFHAPVDIPMKLSGNFGELRLNHFHAGIDIKTNGKIGYPIYSIDKGYISRIRISEGSYGKALYITHPNGYISVYAHLEDFSPEIDAYVKKVQYEDESYTVNLFPEKNELLVQKGSQIALSGNTGSSMGPHLHFEIRTNEHIPLNILNQFSFNIKDNIAPKARALYYYPDANQTVHPKRIRVYKNGTNYYIKDTLLINNGSAFGVEVYDYLNESANRCGVYDLDFHCDTTPIFGFRIDEIPFDKSRFINTHMDYGVKVNNKKNVHKLFESAFNKLDIYKSYGDGHIQIDSNEIKRLSMDFTDAYGNKSQLEFYVQGNGKTARKINPHSKSLDHEKKYSFEKDNIRVELPAYSLYNDVNFAYKLEKKNTFALSETHGIHKLEVPVHKSYDLFLKPDTLIEELENKYIIASFNKKKRLISNGGEWKDGFLHTKLRSFGEYFVVVDTLAPKISQLNTPLENNYSALNQIEFEITDSLSGIEMYSGYIDGQWVLFEYDRKEDHLFYKFDASRIEKGKTHDIELIISDERGNTSFFNSTFFW